MNSRDRQLGWIGLIGGLVGAVVINVAPLDDLLPINQTLFALTCGLMVIWLLAFLTKFGSDKP